MSERVNLADGSAIDMLDPESVRAYVRMQLALNVDPTPAQLKRLEMLTEHANGLKPKAEAEQAQETPDELAEAREHLRLARMAERRGK